ncbi:hypothetical protein [Sutterella sp.]|uniref:hypothetical protein n=1 Tax=Sutterella sp. TaxID=1981025 RepID=UPI003FD8CD8E
MRRVLTLALMLAMLAFWGVSLWTLSERLTPAETAVSCTPAAVGLLMLIGFFVSRRIFNPNDRVRRLFSAVLATTLLLTIALVYADVFFFSGEIFHGGLTLLRLEIFTDARPVLTLAFAGAFVHPILFILSGIALLSLPPPSDNFFRR